MFVTKKPIADAPQDGTELLVWIEGQNFPIAVKWMDYDSDLAEEVGAKGYWNPLENLIEEVGFEVEPVSFVELSIFRDPE